MIEEVLYGIGLNNLSLLSVSALSTEHRSVSTEFISEDNITTYSKVNQLWVEWQGMWRNHMAVLSEMEAPKVR